MNEVQIVAMIVAMTELSKEHIPSKYAPVVAIALGIIFGLYLDPSLEGGVKGLALGLGTTGVYKAVDKIMNKK